MFMFEIKFQRGREIFLLLDDHLLETPGPVEEGGGEGFVCEVSHGVPLSDCDWEGLMLTQYYYYWPHTLPSFC